MCSGFVTFPQLYLWFTILRYISDGAHIRIYKLELDLWGSVWCVALCSMRPPHGPDTVRGRGARRRGFETLLAESGGDGMAFSDSLLRSANPV